MTITQFWYLVLRLIGILTVFSGIGVILSFISVSFFTFDGVDPVMLIALLFSCGFYFFVLYAFVINPNVVIKIFRLTKEMENQEIKIEKSFDFMMRLAVIAVGGFLIVDNLPEAIKFLVGYLWNNELMIIYTDHSVIVFFLVKLLMGYLFLTYSREIANMLKKRMEDKPDTLDDQH